MAFASNVREGIEFPWRRRPKSSDAPPIGGGEGPGKRPGILTQAGANRNLTPAPRSGAPTRVLWVMALLVLGAPAAARTLVLLVQPPLLARDAPGFDAAPLAAYLSRALGEPVRARTSDDVLSHWHAVRAAPDYDLAFDEAHFTDYRIRHHGFTTLVRDAADVRFEVLVRPRTLVTGPSDLAARLVAGPAPPSLGAVRLMALFPLVARAPRWRVVASRAEALDALAAGEVDAALLPADDAGHGVAAVAALLTDVSPGRALSASPRLSAGQRMALARTLVTASAELRRALAMVGVRRLEFTSDAVYEDSERLLRGTWGYR